MRPALALLLAFASPAAAADPAKYIRAELIAESMTPRPGGTVVVGIRLIPKPGWHGYWSNPGDSGFAPTVRWTVPAGVKLGPLLHPAPTLLKVSGMSSFVHEGPHVLLARMTVAQGIRPGTAIPVSASVNWAACPATQCVPLRATLKLSLRAGDGAPGADAAAVRAAARKLPRTAANGRMVVAGPTLRLQLPESLRLEPRRARFFPDTNGVIDAAASRMATKGGTIVIIAPRRGAVPGKISGVVSDGRSAYRLAFVRK